MKVSRPGINSAYAYLGFAMKSGKLKSGAFAAGKAVESGAARLIVLDPEASENTRRNWKNKCEAKNIAVAELPGMGRAIGRPERIVAAITDDGFAAMIVKANNEYNDNNQKSN